MTSQNSFIVPAVASLPPGWVFVPPPDPDARAAPGASNASVSVSRQAIPLPTHTLVLTDATNAIQSAETQWASTATAIRYPRKENSDHHSARSHTDSHLRILKSPHHQIPELPPAMVPQSNLPPKKRHGKSHAHHQAEDVHLVANASSPGWPQVVPMPPPPEPSLASSVASIPTVPYDAETRSGSPFRVWHVCAVCHQPRSKRYHSRHPVRAGDVVPSPSICHRCKPSAGQTSADAYEEVVATRSRDKAFVPLPRVEEVETDEVSVSHSKVTREDYVSDWVEESIPPAAEPPNEESNISSSHHIHTRTRTRVYIDDGDTSAAPTSSKVPASVTARSGASTIIAPHGSSKNVATVVQASEPAASTVPEPLSPRSAIASAQASSHQQSATAWMEISNASVSAPPSSKAASMTSSRVREIAHAEVQRLQAITRPVLKTYLPQLPVIAGGVTHSEVRRIVGEEAFKAAAVSMAPPPVPDHVSSRSSSITPSEVRRIARQEIRSYRGAERALESHTNPYSHVRVEDEEVSQVSDRGSDIYSMLDAPQSQQLEPRNHQDAVPRSTTNGPSSGAEYFYMERTAEVLSNSPSSAGAQPTAFPPEMDRTGRPWPDDINERGYRSDGAYYDDPIEQGSLFAETISPYSSASQSGARDPTKAQAPPRQGQVSRRFLFAEHADFLSGPRRSAIPTSMAVNAGSNLDAQPAAKKGQSERFVADQRPAVAGRSGEEFIDKEYVRASRYVSDQQTSRGPPQDTARLSNRYDTSVAQDRQAYLSRQTLNDEVQYEHVPTRTPGSEPWTRVAVPDEPSTRDATYIRDHYVSSARSRDSDEMTVWPGHVPHHVRRSPLDSVAMHKQRFGRDKGNEDRQISQRANVTSTHTVPRDQAPSPPRQEDIIREDRRIYHETSPSGERIVRERLVRVARDSPPQRQERNFQRSYDDVVPSRYAARVEDDVRFEEPSQPTRGILRPSNSPPRAPGGFYNNAHVTFASKDNIAPTPVIPPSEDGSFNKGGQARRRQYHAQDLDGLTDGRSAGYVESEYSDDFYVDEPVSRGRGDHRAGEIQHYMPKMQIVPSRPLSESPSRERAEELARKAEKKRVKVRVLTDAHGPYRAEVSPNASMEVLTDNGQVEEDNAFDSGAGILRPKGGATDYKLTGRVEGSPQRSLAPGWLKVTKVKKYIDAEGRPYEVVSEEIVLDDEADARR